MSDGATAGQTFDTWLASEVRPFLAERGWRRRAGVFHLPAAPNTALIDLRRWKGNDATTCRFFVEVGVFSPRLAAHEAELVGLPRPQNPTLATGAVAQRLSSLMGERTDLFWAIRAPALSFELAALGESVREKLDRFALPFVEAHLTDELIRDDLLTRVDRLGPTHLRWLRVLLEDLGPGDRLASLHALTEVAERELEGDRRRIGGLFDASDEDVAAADEAMRRLAGR